MPRYVFGATSEDGKMVSAVLRVEHSGHQERKKKKKKKRPVTM